jgi:uncharacterized coiled-coil protein SlyX
MVAAAFPLIKLSALAFRQIAKPIANVLKNRAKESPFFRNYICMPPAQAYHWIEVNVKMKMLGLGKPTKVQKLNETMAIELGAELLGETIIFLSAAATIAAEYIRQTRKSAAEALAIEEKWNKVDNRLEELEFTVDKQSTQIRELTQLLYALQSNYNKLINDNKDLVVDRSSTDSKGLIGKAIVEVKEKLSGKLK